MGRKRLRKRIDDIRRNNNYKRSGTVKGRLSVVDAFTCVELAGVDFCKVMPQHIRSSITIEAGTVRELR